MDEEEKLGQITAVVGRLCLRFKNGPEALLPQGQVFVKCSFVGRGKPFFVSAPPAADGVAPTAVGSAAGATLPPPLLVASKPVDIIEAIASQTEEDNVGNDNSAAAHVVVADMAFSLDTTKFDLTEHTLSMLDATKINIELCLRGGGGVVAGDEAETIIGMATVRVAAVLAGKNEWTDDLALGTYAAPLRPDTVISGELPAEGHHESGVTVEAEINDASSGPLEFGGSTSTMQVKLLTNDDTADYAVGAGSLWADGAEITGVPEGWKVAPPPGTERSAWNDTIAQALAGQPRHEFSLWWGPDPAGSSEDEPEGQTIIGSFPAMILNGGVLSYEPDEESAHVASTSGDSADDTGSQGQASAQAVSRGGVNGSGSGSISGEGDSTPPVPWDPPAGTWSVRFPSSQTRSHFLHRKSIRKLRRALTTPGQDSGKSNNVGETPPARRLSSPINENPTTTVLHVIVERRELRSEPVAEEGKPSGKGTKKGGGKKPAAGKKGESPENPPPAAEAPWRCRAAIDLSPLAQPTKANSGGSDGRNERGQGFMLSPTAASGLAETDNGDSPLRAELRATLALAPLPRKKAAAATVSTDESAGATRKELGDTNGEPGDNSVESKVERRVEQMKAANTTLFLTFALSRPLVKATVRQDTTVSVSDVFVPSDVGPRKPPRDVDVELKEELDAFVLAALSEYAKLFLEPGADEHMQDLSVEDREKHLFYALNSGGLYHSFLERLKPRVQRIVRKRFGAVPPDAAAANEFISDLYVHLVEEAAVVLNHRIKNIETKATPSYIDADPDISLEEKVEHLGMLADDAEARGAREEAAARHEDRIEAATAAAAALEEWRILLARSWEGYALFSLRGDRSGQYHHRTQKSAPGTKNNNENNSSSASSTGSRSDLSLDHATRCLEECLRVYLPGSDESLAATTVLAAVSMEQGQLDRAWALLETVLEQRLPNLEEGADGYETGDLADLVPRRDHALRCILRDLMGDPAGARRSLFLAMQSSKREEASGVAGAIVSNDEPGVPRRTPVRVMQDACAWLLELGLPGMARRAFVVAEESERLAVKKAKGRGLPTRTPHALRESSRRLKCYLTLAETSKTIAPDNDDIVSHTTSGIPDSRTKEQVEIANEASAAPEKTSGDDQQGNASERVTIIPGAVAAERLAQEAVELSPEDPRPWQALAEACDAQGPVRATEAAEAWAAVLDRMEGAWMTFSESGDGKDPKAPTPPLRVYMRLGALYNTLGRIDEAKACFLRGCRAWRAPGPWLGCGAASLRLEQWKEAEDAIQHASRLDCNSSLVWGHLALLLLSMGEDRLQEADRALAQALCLGLADPSLLREIGNCYVAVGRLDAAEDVLRKSLAVDLNSSRSGGGNPHTRRCLGDVLSARNSTSQAVEEYRRVLQSPCVDVNDSERQEVLMRCGNLLRKMGRGDELGQLQQEMLSSRQPQMLA